MDKKETNRLLEFQQRYQKKYRKRQSGKGLVRYEIQIPHQSRDRFEALVKAAAEEYAEPYSERQRLAKARARIFDEITQNVLHEFFTLKEEIQHLKEEIRALSPQFFQSETPDSTPLPEAIRALPDDPQQLKQLLAKTHKTTQQAQLAANEYKRRADQYQKLYEAADDYNEELRARLKENDLPID